MNIMQKFLGILPAFKTGMMMRPVDHPIALPISMDFSTESSQAVDLWAEQTNNSIDFVQALYVSNYNNSAVLTVEIVGGMVFHVPAGAEGWYPIAAEFGKFTALFSTTPDSGLIIKALLANVPVASQQWGPITVNVDQVTATLTPVAAAFTDFSGTAAASAELFAANSNALRRIVQNPATNLNSIFINFGGVAASATTFEIPPGGTFDTGSGPIDKTQWLIYASASTPFVAFEGE